MKKSADQRSTGGTVSWVVILTARNLAERDLGLAFISSSEGPTGFPLRVSVVASSRLTRSAKACLTGRSSSE
jgi:hypothetical protein